MTRLEKPLVSVLIPAYKTADTLEKAVHSALLQMENLEVIIVDDCSPDNTFAVAQKLAQHDERVRAFRLEKNAGAPFARNYAAEHARGVWIAVLDADDWYEAGRLEVLIAEAVAANVEMAADNQYFFDKHANQIVGTAFPQKGQKHIVDLDVFLKKTNSTSKFDYGMFKPIFRMDFLRKNAIEYYVPERIGHDYYILLCFFAAGGRAVIIDTPYYNYVQPFGSISNKPQQEGRKHYDHKLQKTTHQHFIDIFRDKFSEQQMAQLQRRKREIDALISYYDLREALRKKDIRMVSMILIRTNIEFWKMIWWRLIARFHRVFLG